MVVRPIIAELRKRFDVAVSETGEQDLHRRAEVTVAAVSSEHGHAREILENCERLIVGHREIEVLTTRIRTLDDDDLD